jgi:hypothetical protein
VGEHRDLWRGETALCAVIVADPSILHLSNPIKLYDTKMES